ncbi:glycosyltransferase family 4 protein [Sulfurimonas sp.]|uniref:glycosyltransferase family 4 protein n=1 Tax=Sulfurimonas sp. TaxID=2022749 RepID=UPI0035679D33
MRVLKVIHGFPPDYMAGSEVYSYHLVKELINQNIETYVFTRVENEFHEPYRVYNETFENINIQRVNKPQRDYLYTDKFYDDKMDELFKQYLLKVNPDIVHFGHLSHLSTNLIAIAKELKIPIVYTIHDFWLFCVKGQMVNESGSICQMPSIENCTKCSPYVCKENDVKKVLNHMNKVVNAVDVFVSPSITLKDFFVSQGVDSDRIKYMKYGFNNEKIKFNKKIFLKNDKLNFGFMGRVIPTKGVKVLTDTFKELPNESLSIYGNIGVQKRFLEASNIVFKGSYNNNTINEVLNDIDVLIVPSTWYENAPLVIQEAFLAGIPVITSNIGGMKELVDDGVNGYTFEAGNAQSLGNLIRKISENPTLLNSLKQCRDSVVDIKDDVKSIVKVYKSLV